MKLLALSDLHGDYSHINAILDKAGDFEAVLIAGGITDFGPDEKALELLDMFKDPVFAVPGNCDNPSLLKVLDENKNTINMHNSLHTLGEFIFMGLGGSNTTDKSPHGNVGSTALARYLGRFSLIICGHIHEARGVVKVNGTCIVNPGMASKGHTALITIENDIKVDFIDVK